MMRFVARLVPVLFATLLSAAPLRFARTGEIEGTADIQLRASDPWQPAFRNTPLPQGARLRTENGRLETELDDGSVLRLTGSALAEISDYTGLSTGQHLTLLSLDHGTAYFTGRPHTGDTLSVALPGAQITMRNRARVRFDAGTSWTEIAVLEGRVRFATPSAELELHEGQFARVPQETSARFQLLREIPELANDDWSRKRDIAQEASLSAQHLPGIRFGAVDLDLAGSWLQTDDAGLVWKPKVLEGWAPFQTGKWRWYDEIGYTWIAAEEWGWAPYHFGRWLQHSALGWVWTPGASAVFKPGEVYWMRATNVALWGALAPNELWTGQGPARQFAALNTSVARFEPAQRELDPAIAVTKPKDLLTAAQFTVALPSPPLASARLEISNPPLSSASGALLSFSSAPEVQVRGASFEPMPVTRPPVPVAPPPPRPTQTVIVDRPFYVEVPEPVEIFYPVPVYTGVLVMNPVIGDGRTPKRRPPDPSAH